MSSKFETSTQGIHLIQCIRLIQWGLDEMSNDQPFFHTINLDSPRAERIVVFVLYDMGRRTFNEQTIGT